MINVGQRRLLNVVVTYPIHRIYFILVRKRYNSTGNSFIFPDITSGVNLS